MSVNTFARCTVPSVSTPCAAIWVTAPLHPGPASETDNAGAVGNQCNLGFLAIVVILIVWNVHYFTRTFWFLQTLTKTDIMVYSPTYLQMKVYTENPCRSFGHPLVMNILPEKFHYGIIEDRFDAGVASNPFM